MKSKTWTVKLLCYQDEVSDPEQHAVTYKVLAQRAGTAMLRALSAWQRESGKRIGARTGIYMTAVPL